MNTYPSTRSHSRRQTTGPQRVAGVVPVNDLCAICCLILCRIVVPKLANDFGAEG